MCLQSITLFLEKKSGTPPLDFKEEDDCCLLVLVLAFVCCCAFLKTRNKEVKNLVNLKHREVTGRFPNHCTTKFQLGIQ